jgi:hypothetical protein
MFVRWYESKRGRTPYAYVSKRVGKRVVSKYVGKVSHDLAEALGTFHTIRRDIDRESRERRKRLSDPPRTDIEELLDHFVDKCGQLATEALTDASFHRHKRYEPDMSQTYFDRALRRYLNVMRTLANIRKLDLPTIQVNVVSQVVNAPRNG